MCIVHVLLVKQLWIFFFFYHLLSGVQFTAGVDFVQVALDGLQVGDAITTTQLQNQLQQGKCGREVTLKSM